MASPKQTGLTLPAGLLRPTTPHESVEAESESNDDATAVEDSGDEGQGRGASESKPARTRRKRTLANGGESKGRKLVLPDDVHDRLWLFARHRKQTVSAVAADILDRGLPKFRVEKLS